MAIDPFSNKIYVLTDLNTVSVIDRVNNTKIKDIPVGNNPVDIALTRDRLYTANNLYDNSVSVISTVTDTKIKDIPVGNNPVDIAFFGPQIGGVLAYTVNLEGSVSVIATNYTKIKDIPVGRVPTAISFDDDNDLTVAYVADMDSDGISVIDIEDNKVVEGVVFQINPSNSGYIECGELTVPSAVEQYIFVDSGAQCTAKPKPGFEFVSWEENLDNNATHLLQLSPSASPLDSIADFLQIRREEPESKLSITRFGNFTANFKELPPPVPSEYWIPLYGIIASTIVGWSIPSIIGWTKSKRDVRKLNYYHKQIASLYGDGKLDEKDIEVLDRLRNRVGDAYSEGKLSEKHYENLRGEISTLYEEIFRKKIDTLRDRNISDIKKPDTNSSLK